MVISDKDLYNLLLQNEILSAEELKKIHDQTEVEKIPFYDALIKSDLITDENLGRLIADNLKLPFVVLNKTPIPQNLLQTIPESVARSQQTIVFGKTDDNLKILAIGILVLCIVCNLGFVY